MRLVLVLLIAGYVGSALASTIRVEITGTIKDVRVDEGPIFGHSSYEHIPDGTRFILTYTFDDTKGIEKVLSSAGGFITESQIEDYALASPGANATLQIGDVTWEFGRSTHSTAKLSTLPDTKTYQLTFATPSRDNNVSVVIRPAADGFWPNNADWRASFLATSLRDSHGEFSADNGRVSAKGHLAPSTLTVSGVDLGEQWLSYTTLAGGPATTKWSRKWHLTKPSPNGGYIVQELTNSVSGAKSTGHATTHATSTCWEAWRIPSQAIDAPDAIDVIESSDLKAGDTINIISAKARFYEGLTLPKDFSGEGHCAASRLSSPHEPQLGTSHATLPVSVDATLR